MDFLVIGVFSFFLAMGFAPYQVWLAEQFPSYLRTSGLGISYNVAAGVLGGTTALLATALVQFSGSPPAPAALINVSSLTSMVIAFTMKEAANEELRSFHQKPKEVYLRKGWGIGGAVRITGI